MPASNDLPPVIMLDLPGSVLVKPQREGQLRLLNLLALVDLTYLKGSEACQEFSTWPKPIENALKTT